MRRILAKSAIFGLVLAPLTACTSPPSPDSSSLTERDSSQSLDSVTLVKEPFAGLYAKEAENAKVINDATERAIATCMREKGFNYIPTEYRPRTTNDRRVGDVAYAKAHGYGIADGLEEKAALPKDKAVEGERAELKGLSPGQVAAWDEAFGGPQLGPNASPADVVEVKVGAGTMQLSTKGCLASARKMIGGDLKDSIAFPAELENMANQVRSLVSSDKRYKDTESQWRSCMTSAGFGSASELEQIEALHDGLKSGKMTPQQVRAKEIPMATAGAECAVKANIAELLHTLNDQYEKKVLDNNQGFVIRWTEFQEQSLKRAKEYLKS